MAEFGHQSSGVRLSSSSSCGGMKPTTLASRIKALNRLAVVTEPALASIDPRDQPFDSSFVCGIRTEPGLQPTLLATRFDVEEREQCRRKDQSCEAVPYQAPPECAKADTAINGMTNNGENPAFNQARRFLWLREWR